MAKKKAPKLTTLREKLDNAYAKMKEQKYKDKQEEAAEGEGGGKSCGCGEKGCKGCKKQAGWM